MKPSTPNHLQKLAALAAIFVLSTMLIPSAFAQGRQDFTLVNRTGLAINEMYVSPASVDDWGADILEEAIPSGQSADIVFTPNQKATRWDIQFIDENGKKHTFYDKNLMQISEITLTKKSDGTWWATYK